MSAWQDNMKGWKVYQNLSDCRDLVSCAAWAKESSTSGSHKQQHCSCRWCTSDLSKRLDRESFIMQAKRGTTLTDWTVSLSHSHESPARKEKVSCAGGAAEWDVRKFFGVAVGAGRGEDAEMSHGALSLARCAGGTHTCSDVAGRSWDASHLVLGPWLHCFCVSTRVICPQPSPGHANAVR